MKVTETDGLLPRDRTTVKRFTIEEKNTFAQLEAVLTDWANAPRIDKAEAVLGCLDSAMRYEILDNEVKREIPGLPELKEIFRSLEGHYHVDPQQVNRVKVLMEGIRLHLEEMSTGPLDGRKVFSDIKAELEKALNDPKRNRRKRTRRFEQWESKARECLDYIYQIENFGAGPYAGFLLGRAFMELNLIHQSDRIKNLGGRKIRCPLRLEWERHGLKGKPDNHSFARLSQLKRDGDLSSEAAEKLPDTLQEFKKRFLDEWKRKRGKRKPRN